jgi:hypothetical protein
MLAQLDPDTQDKVRRRLALRLEPPVSPAAKRRDELVLVAQLLRSVSPPPGWTFPYAARSQYDSRRTPDSPSSAALVERYGSWRNVCRQAHQLLAGEPNRLHRDRRHPSSIAARRYAEQDAIAAIQECARDINRTPSTVAYKAWRAVAEHRRRGNTTYPSISAIVRLYANRGGWIAALEGSGLLAPPNETVRIIARTRADAVELGVALRACGHLAIHARNQNWIEFQGTLAEARAALSGTPMFVKAEVLWDPRTLTATTPR